MVKRKKANTGSTLETNQLIYESHFETVYRFALYLTRNQEMAEEVTQEAFTIAFEKYHQLRDPSKIAAWIKAITLNTARQHLHEAKKVLPLDKDRINYIQKGFAKDQVNDAVIQKEREEELLEAVKILSDKYQEVIILKYYGDLEVAEIASVLDVAEGTVKSRLFRARDKLKQVIKDMELTAGEGV